MKQTVQMYPTTSREQATSWLFGKTQSSRLELDSDKQGLRLLLVEDERADVALACEMLEESMPEYAWSIDVAGSMGEAIPKLSSQTYHLALVDLGLGDMEGPRTIDVLCMVAPQVPMVVLSGSDSDVVLKEALRRGAFICLQKNKTTPDHLRIALINALSRDVQKS